MFWKVTMDVILGLFSSSLCTIDGELRTKQFSTLHPPFQYSRTWFVLGYHWWLSDATFSEKRLAQFPLWMKLSVMAWDICWIFCSKRTWSCCLGTRPHASRIYSMIASTVPTWKWFRPALLKEHDSFRAKVFQSNIHLLGQIILWYFCAKKL